MPAVKSILRLVIVVIIIWKQLWFFLRYKLHFNTLYNIFIAVCCNYLLVRWRKIVRAFSRADRLNYDRLDIILNSPYLLYSRQEVPYCCDNQVVGYNRKSRSKPPRWEARLSRRKFQVHSKCAELWYYVVY